VNVQFRNMTNFFAISYVVVRIYLLCRGPLALSRKHCVEVGLICFPYYIVLYINASKCKWCREKVKCSTDFADDLYTKDLNMGETLQNSMHDDENDRQCALYYIAVWTILFRYTLIQTQLLLLENRGKFHL
jgi:hypothetical protein